GIWSVVQLPINTDERIDDACLSDEIDFLVGTSVHGIYSNGTAGEFYNQTEAELDKIHDLMAAACHRAGRSLPTGATHMSPVTALERIRRAKSLRPSAFPLTP